jgi:diguanylate cyclase
MEVKEESIGEKKNKLWYDYLDCERRLRTLELEKIDLVQSARLVFKSISLLLNRRGFNNDLLAIVSKSEARLGSERDSQAVFEDMAQSVSSLAGHDSTLSPFVQPATFDPDNSGSLDLKKVMGGLLGQLANFKNNRYRTSVQAINQLLDQNSSLESLFPVFVDLCQKFLFDYSQEIANITNRLNSIIRMLLFIEREYSKFLDLSINNYSQVEGSFVNALVNSLGQIQKTVKDSDFSTDADKLLTQLSAKIEGILIAVKRKNEEDAKLLESLNREKELLINRLDNVRRDYDNFVSESHKTLMEMETIKSVSLRDALTQVYNRRAFDEQISATIANYDSGKLHTFSLVIFDIDFFREVNNTYGHLAGDSILTNVGRIVKESLRSDDFIFRYGGDEFIILLPEANLSNAIKVAEKLRHQLEVVEFKLTQASQQSIKVSISVGVTESQKGDNPNSVLARADKALYVSKSQGRNKVSFT